MMKKAFFSLALIGAVAATTSAHATNVGVTAEVGTTGVGVHLVLPVHSSLNARIGANAFNYSYDESTRDADYEAKLKLKTFDALLDFYPTSTQFRLTTGVIYNGNKIAATAQPKAGGTYTYNGNTYSTSDVGQVNGKIDFKKIAPYLGIGWGNAVAKDKGFGFTADVGVMFQSSPDVALTSTGCTSADSEFCRSFLTDLASESARLREEAKDFRYYPVVRLGVTYKF